MCCLMECYDMMWIKMLDFLSWYLIKFWMIFKKIFDLLINCWFFFVLIILDVNYLLVKVWKVVILDVWDLGVLIYLFYYGCYKGGFLKVIIEYKE